MSAALRCLGGERRFRAAVPDLGREGIDAAASSVRVLRGKWMLPEHQRFRGRCRVIEAAGCVRDLHALRLDDVVSLIMLLEPLEGEGVEELDACSGGRRGPGPRHPLAGPGVRPCQAHAGRCAAKKTDGRG